MIEIYLNINQIYSIIQNLIGYFYFITIITNMNHHNMTTRSKAKGNTDTIDQEPSFIQPEDDVDEKGNLKGFIDYDMEEDPKAMEELKKQLYFISNGSEKFGYETPKKNKRRNKHRKKDKNLNNIVMSYLIMKATDKANEELKKKNKLKKTNKSKEKEIEFIDELNENESPIVDDIIDETVPLTEEESDIELESEEEIDITEPEEEISEESEKEEEEENEEEDEEE